MSGSPFHRVLDRSIDRRFLALLVGLVVAGGLAVAPAAGAASVQDSETRNASLDDSANDTAPTELQPIDVANASGNDTDAITLQGEGPTVTDPVAFEDGLLVAAYGHDGESNVQMTLWNESADEAAAYLVNEIGAVDGTTAVPVTEGNYSVDVTADGAWNLTLVQNASAALAASDAGGNATGANDTATGNDTIASAPATASGEGPTVLGPVRFDDSVTLTANHSGESNVQVTIWNESASTALDGVYAVNEIGQVEAAETRVGTTGVAWIVVQADGAWDLRFD